MRRDQLLGAGLIRFGSQLGNGVNRYHGKSYTEVTRCEIETRITDCSTGNQAKLDIFTGREKYVLRADEDSGKVWVRRRG
jgi:hypothetical protein